GPSRDDETASPLFFKSLLHDLGLELLLDVHLAQAGVLGLQLLHARHHRHIHAAVLRAPLVEGRRADALPPRLRARRRRGKIYYYYDLGGRPRKEVSLGSDYISAIQEWAKREQVAQVISATFNDAANLYVVEKLPTKAARTQQDNLKELPFLREFFGDAALDEIEPVHIKQFMDWRRKKAREWLIKKGRKVDNESGHVRANRERALFSHIFNFARGKGLTSSTNPCLGIDTLKESGRDVYVDDATYQTVWEAADEPLRDAMDLAYLTGQRPADTVNMTEHDIKDGHLHVRQGKTSTKLRIAVTGEL